MDDGPGSDTATPTTGAARKKSGRGVLWGLIAVVLAFSAGFFWQFYEASTVREELSAAEQELAVERLRIRLGQAAIAAQSGEFESARRQMSEFFTQAERNSAVLTPEVSAVAEDFLAMRDEIITGLSRSNPEYAAVLYGMLETLGNAIDGGAGAVTGTPEPEGVEGPDPGS